MLTPKESHLVRRLKRAPAGAEDPGLGRLYRIELEPGRWVPQAATDFNNAAGVEYAELNWIISIYATPNDPNYGEQWPLDNEGNDYPAIGGGTISGTKDCDIYAPEAWEINTGSSDVIVAVIDTGVDYDHLDIKENMWSDANGSHGYNFVADNNDPMDDEGHGTHVAGTIAADGNNGIDIAGVAWEAKIMAVKIWDANGVTNELKKVKGIYYGIQNGADILSNSWGGQMDNTPAIKDAFDTAYNEGVLCVAAAGNHDFGYPYYPAGFDTVLAVAATDANDQRAIWPAGGSNYGYCIDVAAPGDNILSLKASDPNIDPNLLYPYGDPNATMWINSGTSMACPHVSGLAALCLSQDPNLKLEELRWLIRNSADDVSDPNLGDGRINAYKALYGMTHDPCQATDPYPPDGANCVSVNVDSLWEPAFGALSHDVYIGTDYNSVNDANTSSDEFLGKQYSYIVDQNALAPNTTYYWRVDEKNNQGSTKGDVWSFTTCSNAGIYYVDANENPGGNGNSWSTAFDDLQDALDANLATGDQIWVAQGTYKPTTGSDRSISFELSDGIQVYGGFPTGGGQWNQRNPATYETILSGDIGEVNDYDDNSYHVLIGADNAVLDGFTITAGNANGAGDECRGGGMYNWNCSPIVRNCCFLQNKAKAGGGIHNLDGTRIIIENSTFTGNNASIWGGGVCNTMGWAKILNCTFSGNKAGQWGGGLANEPSCPTIVNCIFWGNEAKFPSYAEIYNYRWSIPTISYCNIKGCNGSGDGWNDAFGTDGGGNIESDPCFLNYFDFSDMTTASGTTTTIKVADASLYEVNDVIEYDDDGVVRTVTDVNTTTDIVTFSNALDAGSTSGIGIFNWGVGATDLDEDYHLDSNSLCIDAGDPNEDYFGKVDIDNQARVMGYDDGVDIGADEFLKCSCLGDCADTNSTGDRDGRVDMGDVNALVTAMNEAYPDGDPTGLYELTPIPAYFECMDVADTTGYGDPDGKVDIGDLNALLFEMLEAYPDGDPTGIYEVPCL